MEKSIKIYRNYNFSASTLKLQTTFKLWNADFGSLDPQITSFVNTMQFPHKSPWFALSKLTLYTILMISLFCQWSVSYRKKQSIYFRKPLSDPNGLLIFRSNFGFTPRIMPTSQNVGFRPRSLPGCPLNRCLITIIFWFFGNGEFIRSVTITWGLRRFSSVVVHLCLFIDSF